MIVGVQLSTAYWVGAEFLFNACQFKSPISYSVSLCRTPLKMLMLYYL